MMPGTARPTQVHAVPFEERAPDGKGGKLPFALEYPPYDLFPALLLLSGLLISVQWSP